MIHALAARLGREGIAGIFVGAAGVFLWIMARGLARGTLAEIGPGFVPWISSLALVALGGCMLVRAMSKRNDDGPPQLGRGVVVVPLGMGLFAFGLESLGLFAASALGVFVTTFASRESGLIERAAVAFGLAAGVTLLFGYGLGMTVPLWPVFLRP